MRVNKTALHVRGERAHMTYKYVVYNPVDWPFSLRQDNDIIISVY